MRLEWPRAWGEVASGAVLRQTAEDFFVDEIAGFDLSGDGEHCFLRLQKRGLNTADVAERLSRLASVPLRDIGYAGLKDRHAVTCQWFSVGLAGKDEPDWSLLEQGGDIVLLEQGRHRRKLRRGAHRGNRFRICLRQLKCDKVELEAKLGILEEQGAPNYFGEQRFGRDGQTLVSAIRQSQAPRRISRQRRGRNYSALRAYLFNDCLARRVERGSWNALHDGDVCMLARSNSLFLPEKIDAELVRRVRSGDVNPGLPLWGRTAASSHLEALEPYRRQLVEQREICDFLEQEGLELAWRAARIIPDDFSWEFCDDDSLLLEFSLGAGGYATALLGELVQYRDGSVNKGGISSEQG